MPSKVYSKEQKDQINVKLLDVALMQYSKYGIRNVTLMNVLKAVGISKPFFYTFYDSVQEFVVRVLEYQWTKFPKIFEDIDSQTHLLWEEKIYLFLSQVIHYPEHGLLIMTQEEEIWVRSKIDDEAYQRFMNDQIRFFQSILERWEIHTDKCSPNVLGNMILSIILIHSSAAHSLPFLYLDILDETADAQIHCLIAYLKTLKNN